MELKKIQSFFINYIAIGFIIIGYPISLFGKFLGMEPNSNILTILVTGVYIIFLLGFFILPLFTGIIFIRNYSVSIKNQPKLFISLIVLFGIAVLLLPFVLIPKFY